MAAAGIEVANSRVELPALNRFTVDPRNNGSRACRRRRPRAALDRDDPHVSRGDGRRGVGAHRRVGAGPAFARTREAGRQL